ncbi:Acyl carrier protein associated with anthrachelin biosynthesis [Grimontia indica]|uniref:Acyl carrier protein associated with anthrachelin biosynthesis n=1 Tax=Grimontia indica TaxID=1056512 RepID=R1J1P6_9GAMM|nr:DUF6005 family protein [Grimontia indica]EOD81500.1 Acyl carrier protein associated with anthrachelin biosynthesis [Grimontia indica]
MEREQLIASIRQVLSDNMQNAHMEKFSESARLNEDLYLDSVLILQLILHLELDLGLTVPEENITAADYATVSSLADFLCRIERNEPAQKAQEEEFEDVKVHCFVSCVCESLKRKGIDHRPFYFGVWDATFTISENYQLQYHSDEINHGSFLEWYHRLYGVALAPWYDEGKTKQDNIEEMQRLLATKAETSHLMVMLDMYQLPERENKFNQNPFPHYVMLENTHDPKTLFMSDPDFRWEGELESARIFNAISQPSVAGGYLLDETGLQHADDRDVQAYFEACFIADGNPLTSAIRRILDAHVRGYAGVKLTDLSLALREIRVIAVRKYAYEHGFAFFWRALGLPDDDFEIWCDVIEELIQTYGRIQYQIMKLAETGDLDLQVEIYALLNKQDRTEFRIKKRLNEVYRDWCELNDLPLEAAVEVA